MLTWMILHPLSPLQRPPYPLTPIPLSPLPQPPYPLSSHPLSPLFHPGNPLTPWMRRLNGGGNCCRCRATGGHPGAALRKSPYCNKQSAGRQPWAAVGGRKPAPPVRQTTYDIIGYWRNPPGYWQAWYRYTYDWTPALLHCTRHITAPVCCPA